MLLVIVASVAACSNRESSDKAIPSTSAVPSTSASMVSTTGAADFPAELSVVLEVFDGVMFVKMVGLASDKGDCAGEGDTLGALVGNDWPEGRLNFRLRYQQKPILTCVFELDGDVFGFQVGLDQTWEEAIDPETCVGRLRLIDPTTDCLDDVIFITEGVSPVVYIQTFP